MSAPQTIRVWTHGACNPHGGHGGWAYVIVDAGTARGEAGGERNATPHAMAVTAIIRALASLPAEAGPVQVASSDPVIVAGEAPDEVHHAAAWTQLAAALAARPVRIVPSPARAEPLSPAGFVQAWSAFAVEKVKAGGPFRAPIPKPNLLKFPALTERR